MNTKKRKNGFTLIEALFAAMLLGLVVAALAAASGAFTMANGYGVDLSTAEFLIEEMRELTANEDFDTLLAGYDGQTFNPPKDVSNTDMSAFAEFSQQVQIDYVTSGDFTNTVTGPTDFVRVTVTVSKGTQPISSTSWIRAQLSE
ncbi:MAG: prepilin-type N-terminal cleavage/methylation domain-containing protein [Planctomycetota bacterium]|jgi:type II secretory pathway pseudopilin PulG